MALFGYHGSRLKKAKYDRVCERCALTISIDYVDCPHCGGLSNSEMISMLDKRVKDGVELEQTGRTFAVYACVFAIVLIVALMVVRYLRS